ncbi:DUF58 domain-containing protein [Parahaliea sp. F7430]|uniref:DUF58 domain-containing protein n=1 Tax=Sediminihaliea albiluteola TaxID=2758564 RepID=A0A7W2TUB7_9GAMM|nr:DUF58 domain-containing protein [Sediminihaliea albiluteola]MBA6412049.1 DUF58 domain-containing protein [Sediminihaliea albiluteola]
MRSQPKFITRYPQVLARRFSSWLSRRIPPARSVTLNQKGIFIMPSRVGFLFFIVLLVMLLAAINYQNNMAYALTFLLATLFVIGILHTYANLSGLTIHAVQAMPAYPGQRSRFDLRLERGSDRPRFALRLCWPDSSEHLLNLQDAESVSLSLFCTVGKRGWHHPGRLLVESSYPLGLLRCWTWVDLDLRAMVYPQPIASPEPSERVPGGGATNSAALLDSDDFFGFRDYRLGDSLSQLHWKAYAKGHGLKSKQYASYAQRSLWLNWDSFAGLATEQRLSHLCFWALEFDRQQALYGLRLPGVLLAPASGERQLEKVLSALALYGQDEPSDSLSVVRPDRPKPSAKRESLGEPDC